MNTVTLPKSEFNLLKRRASLYEAILRFLPERKWGKEEYTKERIRKFMLQDRLERRERARLKKILFAP